LGIQQISGNGEYPIFNLLKYQHNEQARAALSYSSKKPTRRDARHQADGRKHHNQKSKHHPETAREHGDLANRGGCGESSCGFFPRDGLERVHLETRGVDKEGGREEGERRG
jgi:hypothetical protein